ncbi:hypothetical protein BJ912DRAFT_1143232 [Pholiota molesta]|nr:hypothetical protein BJ912DRAFT_1143232 [Pholiota molesta]
MLSSKSSPSTKSPISTVPYDILFEIFVRCLPQDRFEIRQPETRIAPILLCHICSSWRAIALTTPILWSQLSFCFTIRGWAFVQNEIDFIRWWKKNQGSIAPFLRLAIDGDHNKFRPLAGDVTTVALVMNYMSTAQHLEIEPLFWDLVPAVMYRIGEPVTLFPNLHTLVAYECPPRSRTNHYFHHMFPALRRLAIVDKNQSLKDTSIPAQWATLTHLSITTFIISLDFWVHLTSAVPRLQWAYVYFNHHTPSDPDKYANPIPRILPQLSTLFIRSSDNNGNDSLLSPLFVGLRLPALRNLFLASVIGQWWDHSGITDIHTILQSAPALQNLTLLKYNYLSRAEINYAKGTAAAVGGVGPIWSCVPHLVHLQLELYIARDYGDRESEAHAEKELAIFARSAFFSNNRWLDLDNPVCPIKTITVIDPGLSSPSHQPESDTHRKPPIIRKCVGNASNIALHVISQPFTDFADSWKEWRSGN